MPWGTPEETGIESDDAPSRRTHCVLLERKVVIQSSKGPVMP